MLNIQPIKLLNTKSDDILTLMKQFGAFYLFLFMINTTVIHLAILLDKGPRVFGTVQNVLRVFQPPSISREHCYTPKCQNILLEINPQKMSTMELR